MTRFEKFRLGLGLVVISGVTTVQADNIEIIDQPLPNGDFSSGLSEWTVGVSPDSAVPAGSVTVVNGAARLAKGGAFLAELSQGFEAPEGLRALRLTLAELPQFGSTGGFIPEAFDIHLIGASGFSRVASFRPGVSSAANATALPPGFNLGDGVTMDGQNPSNRARWRRPGRGAGVLGHPGRRLGRYRGQRGNRRRCAGGGEQADTGSHRRLRYLPRSLPDQPRGGRYRSLCPGPAQ